MRTLIERRTQVRPQLDLNHIKYLTTIGSHTPIMEKLKAIKNEIKKGISRS